MPYTTPGRIRKALADPTDDDLPGDVITQILEDETAYIESALSHLYPVPFDSLTLYPAGVPPMIRRWATALTVYGCLKHPQYRMRPGVDTAFIEQSREVAVAQVRDAARRKMRIPEKAARDSTGSNTEDRVRTFGLDDPLQWGLDPDTEREQEDNRSKE